MKKILLILALILPISLVRQAQSMEDLTKNFKILETRLIELNEILQKIVAPVEQILDLPTDIDLINAGISTFNGTLNKLLRLPEEELKYALQEITSKIRYKNAALLNFAQFKEQVSQEIAKKIIQLLIKYGADVNTKDQDNATPLILAVFTSKNISIVEELVEQGADINAIGTTYKETALSTAQEDPEFIKFLISKGADVNLGEPPILISAVIKGYFDIVELLLKHNADINVTDLTGKTALETAKNLLKIHKEPTKQKQYQTIVNLLEEKTINIEAIKKRKDEILNDIRDKIDGMDSSEQNKFFYELIVKEQPEQLKPLFDFITPKLSAQEQQTITSDIKTAILNRKGIDVNYKDANNKTILMWAAEKGQDSIVHSLLHLNADKTLKDNNNKTALDYAQEESKKAQIQQQEAYQKVIGFLKLK